MKKQLVPIFVMSIISFLISVISVGYTVYAITLENAITGAATTTDNSLDDFLALLGSLLIVAFIVVGLIVFVTTALLGVFGILCALKDGRFSLACVILGSIGTVLLGVGTAALITTATNEFDPTALIPCLYFVCYTISAITAFRYRKKSADTQSKT